jgi:tetratricopeptide (TPR) repeat protein
MSAVSVGSLALQNAHELLKAQDYKAAERAYKKVLDSIDEHDDHYNLVLSAYGLSQVLKSDDATSKQNGLLQCRDAANNESIDGDVFLNLACAEWVSNNRKRVIDALRQGIKIDADNQRLNNACLKVGCRKRCCFSFLPRSHKVNRFFGRLFRRPEQTLEVHHLLF